MFVRLKRRESDESPGSIRDKAGGHAAIRIIVGLAALALTRTPRFELRRDGKSARKGYVKARGRRTFATQYSKCGCRAAQASMAQDMPRSSCRPGGQPQHHPGPCVSPWSPASRELRIGPLVRRSVNKADLVGLQLRYATARSNRCGQWGRPTSCSVDRPPLKIHAVAKTD